MAKRSADKYITDQNWDQEEETEEAGVFRQADQDILQKRVIKKAARRPQPEGGASDSGSAGAFKGFAGFGGFGKTSQSSGTGLFSNTGAKPLSFSNGSSTLTTDDKDKSKIPLFSTTVASKTASDTKLTFPVFGTKSEAETQPDLKDSKPADPPRVKYLHQVKSLNEGVTKWIKEHVDKNPYCILTPIFKDYEKYLAEIEKKYPPSATTRETSEDKSEETVPKKDSAASLPKVTVTSDATIEAPTLTSPPAFTFGSAGDVPASSSITTSSTTIPSTASTFTGFKFGSTSGSSSVFGGAATSGFSNTFSFATSKKPQTSDGAAANNDEAEYMPPKAEVNEVKESDAIYTKRCKLFFKKEDRWTEKGVGNLHLKPCGEKTQLLIRADTSLGNILLNIMLSSSLPLNRQGKNNVSLVCVPNPPLDEKKADDNNLLSMLIRVKTAEDADELFEKLKEHKS